MAKKTINIGQTTNDKSGDPLRTAFGKVNDNFTELYNAISVDVQIPSVAGNDGKVLATDGIGLAWAAIPTPSSLVNGDLSVSLNSNGTLTTPLLIPKTFTAVLDETHMVTPVALTDTPWEFVVEFQVNPDSTVQTMIGNNTPWFTNPGYADGFVFTYTEADHGIPGYTFTLEMYDVINPGGAGWTTNLAATEPPTYPSTISSSGAIKLTSNTNSWILGTDGKLTLPAGGDIIDSNGTSVLGTNTTTGSWTKTDAGSIANGVATVIWSSSYDYISSAKLFIQVECDEVSDTTGWHSQACEAIIASRGYASGISGFGDPDMAVYGVINTSVDPLVTFTVQRNTLTRLIEVVATTTATADGAAQYRIHSVEMATRD